MTPKAILTTVYSGFNYGSSLQALAGKKIIEQSGLECELIKFKSLVKGRDFRLKKLLTIFFRSIFLSKTNILKNYQNSYNKSFVAGTEELFYHFTEIYLCPKEISWSQLKKIAKSAVACFSGSDQIWNSTTLYVDPLYYLRFAPPYKRIALSPSFGRNFIADYNKKKMAKWIREYSFLSIREDSGVALIKELTGKTAEHLLDPTLIINASQWKEILKIKNKRREYILAYFLDTPSPIAKETLKKLKNKLNCEIIAIPYQFEDMSYCDRVLASGPKEFVDLITNARFICTDSFHGTAFAINMHTPFFVFEREYGSASKQSERILSILRKVNMMERYQQISIDENIDNINFEYAENILNKERNKAYMYINNAITEIKKYEK